MLKIVLAWLGYDTMGDTFNFRLLRWIERGVKYVFISCDAMMTVHCALLLMGVHHWLPEFLCGISALGFVILMVTSYLFHFCRWYRISVLHAFTVQAMIFAQREFGLGVMLTPLRWAMLVFGIVIFVELTCRSSNGCRG